MSSGRSLSSLAGMLVTGIWYLASFRADGVLDWIKLYTMAQVMESRSADSLPITKIAGCSPLVFSDWASEDFALDKKEATDMRDMVGW